MKTYRDPYFLKAKREHYPARSVYKLQEIDAKFHVLRPGFRVVDLGACPGSWTLWTAAQVGAKGQVYACDLHPLTIDLPKNVQVFTEDVFARTPAFEEILATAGPFDVVLSDMAPATTGSTFTDQARSYALAEAAFQLACTYLQQGGNFVVKIFMGPDVQTLLAAMRPVFRHVKTFKPKSSRSESKETFLIGIAFCGTGSAQNDA